MPDSTRSLAVDDAVLLLTRLVTLGMGAVAAFAIAGLDVMWASVALLGVVAASASILSRTRARGPWLPIAEALAAGAVIGFGPPQANVLLPYLIAPAVSGGLWFGGGSAVLATLASSIALLGAGSPREAASGAQWFIIVLGSGLLAAWLRRTRLRAGPTSEQRAYEQAASLLTELRTLTRPLSGGLDPRPLGAGLLADLAAAVPLQTATVLLQVGSDRRPVAEVGNPTAARAQAEARSAQPTCPVIPVVLSGRSVAAVVVEEPAELDSGSMRDAILAASPWALRLEAAALFEEVRELATRAERARLARDLHDGIAQDVASLGFLADELIHANAADREDDLLLLRERIGELVGQLRLSIHDLREEGTTTMGLSAAIADLARREAASAGMAVHLRLADAPTRLSPETETEIFRIAQEALANVRQHSGARNVWVSTHVGPGGVVVSVEDDGVGLVRAPDDRLGLKIMTERAARIGAQLSIRPRETTGTIVELTFEPATVSGKV